MQPSTPSCIGRARWRFSWRSSARRRRTFCSAFSRMAQVLSSTTSASAGSRVRPKPCPVSTDATTSESATFIWQPYVSM